MNNIFLEAFVQMFFAIAKILLVAITAAILIKKDIFKEQYIKGLSELVVVVLLPAMIFDNITTSFDPHTNHYWWILPLLGFATPLVSLIFITPLYLRNLKENLNKIPFATFQNGGYLVLPIGQLLYKDQFTQFAMYVFLYIIGLNLSLWTVGKVLITRQNENKKLLISNFISPPFIANILSLTLVFLKINIFIPKIISDPVKMLGAAAVPIATFVLGATIGSISIDKIPKFSDIAKTLSVKYIIIPAITMIILLKTKVYITNPLLSDFLVIEASAAPAANLILMVKKYGGNSQQAGSFMLIAYLSAILFMPLALGLWKMIIQ